MGVESGDEALPASTRQTSSGEVPPVIIIRTVAVRSAVASLPCPSAEEDVMVDPDLDLLGEMLGTPVRVIPVRSGLSVPPDPA